MWMPRSRGGDLGGDLDGDLGSPTLVSDRPAPTMSVRGGMPACGPGAVAESLITVAAAAVALLISRLEGGGEGRLRGELPDVLALPASVGVRVQRP